MSVLCQKDGKDVMFVKGAPENIIERCKYVRYGNGEKSNFSQSCKDSVSKILLDWGKGKVKTSLKLKIFYF